MEDLLQVGAVTSPHGLAGEVKVFPMTDDPARFKKLKTVLLKPKNTGSQRRLGSRINTGYGKSTEDKDALNRNEMQEFAIERVRFFKNMVILKFRGLDRVEDVEGLRGCGLYVTRENAVPLEEGEYFIADLIGLKVYADEPFSFGEETADAKEDKRQPVLLGELTDVLQTGANDVYEVTLSDGREVLIPAIRQCILGVDLEEGTMLVHLLEGLLE
ncbi:MAG: ribosome maturation factor RimM [Clostridiales bacterium]|nr:ribosome maturation factor RimM [Clostridiales bacterium]